MLDSALIPFFLLLLLYVVTFSPHMGRAPEDWKSVVLKVLPVWYLAFYVFPRSSGATARRWRSSSDSSPEEKSIKTRFFIGLLISSIGDACLVYTHLFKEGILAFGVAQFMYLLALKQRYRKSRLAWVAVPLGIALTSILVPGINEMSLKILVIGYSLLIHSMLFFAIAGYESFPSAKSRSAMIGACFFIASDFLIALNKWVMVTPYSQASILLTYYTAQFLLTIGIS